MHPIKFKQIAFLWLVLCCVCFIPEGKSQYYQRKTVLDRAHDRKIKTEEFVTTNKKQFYAKVYSVDKVATHRTHHWFLKLADLEGNPLNYAEVTLKGYYKNDPSIAFTYGKTVFNLCSEGKYIIGFVKVKHAGTWVLEASIKNGQKRDTLIYEIEIGDASKQERTQ